MERFLEELGVDVGAQRLERVFLGVAGHHHDAHPRPAVAQAMCELWARDPGQHEVGQEQVVRRRRRERARLLAACGGRHRVPERAEDLEQPLAGAVLVLDQQDPLAVSGGRHRVLSETFGLRRRLRRPRQRDGERGALAVAARHGDGAAVRRHDAVDDGQAQARTLPDRLGGEERLEQVFARRLRDAAAGVGHR